MLSENQLQSKLDTTIQAYENIFGEKPTDEQLLDVLETAIAKRQEEVLTSRLTDQRADRDLLGLRALLAAKSEAPKPEKKVKAKKSQKAEFVPNASLYAENK